jgi:hypothetical protein
MGLTEIGAECDPGGEKRRQRTQYFIVIERKAV